jgi:hypothetical protein
MRDFAIAKKRIHIGKSHFADEERLQGETPLRRETLGKTSS